MKLKAFKLNCKSHLIEYNKLSLHYEGPFKILFNRKEKSLHIKNLVKLLNFNKISI